MVVEEIKKLVEFSSQRYVVKLVHDSEKARVALFCLEPGQKVEAHTSPSEVVFYAIEGKGKVVVGEAKPQVQGGTIVVCPPQAPHGLEAESRLIVLAVIAPRP